MKVPDVYKQESSVDAESIAEKLQNNRLLRRKRKGGASSKRYKKYNNKRRNKNGQSSVDDVSTQRPDPVSSSNNVLSQGTVTVPEEDVVADSGVKDVVRMIGGGDDVSTQRPDPVSSSNNVLSQGTVTVSEEDVVADSGVNDGVRMRGDEESQPEVAEVDLWSTCLLEHDENRTCDNCCRVCFDPNPDSPYYFDMFQVYSHNISKISSPLRKIKAHNSRETAVSRVCLGEKDKYHLCRECCGFLSKATPELGVTEEQLERLNRSRSQWSKIWPSFIWDLLSGVDIDSNVPFREVYSAPHLWKFVPVTIRRYWLHHDMFQDGDYFECTEAWPPAFFEDRTLDLNNFTENISAYTCKGFLNAMDPSRLCDPNVAAPKPFVLPDTLCPWGCSEYPHRACPVDPSLLIQRHLPKVQLNLSPLNGHENMFRVEHSRLDYLRLDGEQVDTILLNDDWKVLPSMIFVRGKGLCVLYCRHHASSSSQRRLYTHPPKKPGNILSSTRTDRLSHCVVRPRSLGTVKAHAYNTSMTANLQSCGYAGSDSADVHLFSDRGWSPCLTLFNHELLHYYARRDTRDLVAAQVRQGRITRELELEWQNESRRRYEGNEDMLSMARRGATSVPTLNALKLQMHATERSKIAARVLQRQTVGGQRNEVDVMLERSWSPTINNIQTEDPQGYGSFLKAIKPYHGRNGNATMMMWVLVGMTSACNLLHYSMDQKHTGHHYNNYSGHLLAHINAHYMKHRDSSCPRKSPFNGRRSASFLLGKIRKSMPEYMDILSQPTAETFFQFDLEYMEMLFPLSDYENIRVCSDFDAISEDVSDDSNPPNGDVDIFITVGKKRPVGDANFLLHGKRYEALVVIAIDVESEDVTSDKLEPNHYSGVRFARHGSGVMQWWKQSRSRRRNSKQMMKQHVQRCGSPYKDPFPDLPESCFYYVCVFVKVEQPIAKDYRVDMFRCVGAQCTVFCNCLPANPLIVSGKKKSTCRECMTEGCKSPEKYCCSNFGCTTRICEECFKGMCSNGGTVTLQPPMVEGESDDQIAAAAAHDDDDDDDNDSPLAEDDSDVEDEIEDPFADCLDSDEYSDCGDDESSVDSSCWEEDDRDSVEDSEFDDSSEYESSSSSSYAAELDESGEEDSGGARQYDSDADSAAPVARVEESDDPYEEYAMYADYNYIDEAADDDTAGAGDDNRVPRSNAAAMPVDMMIKDADEFPEHSYSAPMHVLFNQLGSLCTRFNKRITGTQFQQHFVQSVVSCMRGFSFPLLYVSGMLFPKHFWSTATHDPSAILGAMPISCYRKKVYADGFASHLQHSRMYATSSSSSTSTDHNFVAHLYDSLCNRVQSDMDSRAFRRLGFKVSSSNVEGMELGDGDDSRLHECLNSKQAARNLAAASQYIGFDLFHTFTMNAAEHPGIRHLYDWKESMGWTEGIDNWEWLSDDQAYDVQQSFEMAYTCIVNRNWLETRRLLLDFVIKSAKNILGRETIDAFFRDEYQESTANVCHIHGLIALSKADLSNDEFKEFVCNLQRNAICDLIISDEIDEFIEEGILRDEADWERYMETAEQVLTHKCDNRCKKRVDDTGDDDKDLKCRKRHPVHGREDPHLDDFELLPFEFSQECKNILSQCDFYEDAETAGPGFPNGRIVLESLRPKRHIGKVTPSARCNMSEVIPKYFGLTRSMQNTQITADSNKVSSYVVKYIVKLDQGNRCIVWADQHTGAVVRCENQFIYNSKIKGSARLEEKKFNKSKAKNHYVGRYSPFSEIQHTILGYPEVLHTMEFVEINSLPFELRPTTKISLDKQGYLRRPAGAQPDAQDSDGEVCVMRRHVFGSDSWRNMSQNQILTFNNGGRCLTRNYDKVSLFGLRPVELMKLFPVLPQYYRWFKIEDAVLSRVDILDGLNQDITRCMWIDSLGRRVRLRRNALPEVKERLEKIDDATLEEEELITLKNHILGLVQSGSPCSLFIAEDVDHRLPVPVLSSVTPRHAADFLLHCLLMIGEVSTELDLRCAGSMKETMAKAKLIPNEHLDDEEHLKQYSIHVLKRVIREVFPYQALTMRELQEYIIKGKRLFDSVLLEDAIPLDSLPSCLLTELLNDKDSKLAEAWRKTKQTQVDMIYPHLLNMDNIPAKDEVVRATKAFPVTWDPVDSMRLQSNQTPLSLAEQSVAIGYGKRAVDKYCQQFGVRSRTKNLLFHGMPGAGKTFVSLISVLYGISQGLRVMSAALMAYRSQVIGGVHLHRLFCLEVKKNSNMYRMAELAVEKLHRKSNIQMLHYLLTMDVILLDEVGQLSAQQFMQLDIILRAVRCNNLPFGGVLILGTFDHTQLGAIEGLPFLMSTLIQTDFNLVQLKHSVRAHNDAALQEIQRISRMDPNDLIGNETLERNFKTLVRQTFNFVPTMSDPRIGPQCHRLYAKKKKAVAAAEEYVATSTQNLVRTGVEHLVVPSEDSQRTAHSNATFRTVTDGSLLSALNRQMREPQTLLFYRGAKFESTVNGNGYSYSQELYMRDIPSIEDVRTFSDITLWAKPPSGTLNTLQVNNGEILTEEELRAGNWTKVQVQVSRERLVKSNHLEGRRRQYCLRHIFSSTINKMMGSTIYGPVAIEMSEDCLPWEKGHVVVMISRTTTGSDIYIVGDMEYAINKMYEIICRKNQWTDMTATILRNLSINTDGISELHAQPGLIPLPDVFPYRICDVQLPTSKGGYVYMLVSLSHPTFTYVGTTERLGKRLNEHNSGSGADSTAPAMYMPYGLAAYLITPPHFDESQRMSIESRWQRMNQQARIQGNADLGNLVDIGRSIMTDSNSIADPDEQIRFVNLVTQR